MTVLGGWCTSPSAPTNPPFQSRQAQLESGVRGNVPAPFGAGERLQGPTYRYPDGQPSALPGKVLSATFAVAHAHPTTNPH